MINPFLNLLETNPGARINVHRQIRLRSIQQPWSVPKGCPKLFYLLWAPFKAAWMLIQLFWIMTCITQRPDFVLVQVNYKCPPLLLLLLFTHRQKKIIIESTFYSYLNNCTTCFSTSQISTYYRLAQLWIFYLGHHPRSNSPYCPIC